VLSWIPEITALLRSASCTREETPAVTRHDEDWLEHMLRRDEELAQRLVTTPTPTLIAAARHYLDTNLHALGDARSREIPRAEGRRLARGGLLGNGVPRMGRPEGPLVMRRKTSHHKPAPGVILENLRVPDVATRGAPRW
jgi:hypothetical protein